MMLYYASMRVCGAGLSMRMEMRGEGRSVV